MATAPTIRDLFDSAALTAAVVDGYVRKQIHPTEPLAILNYTEKAAYEGMWNTVTLNCRGLIHHVETGRLVARPFRKQLTPDPAPRGWWCTSLTPTSG